MQTQERGPGRPAGSLLGEFPTTKDGKLTRMYRKWTSMHARCYRTSHPAYPWYGGRGVTVCPEWHGRAGFDRFCHDMGEAPAGLTLDRINGKRGYEPDNCQWSTWKQQAGNRRARPQVEGSLRQKAKSAGLKYGLVFNRIQRGWPEGLALTIPAQKRGPMTYAAKKEFGLRWHG